MPLHRGRAVAVLLGFRRVLANLVLSCCYGRPGLNPNVCSHTKGIQLEEWRQKDDELIRRWIAVSRTLIDGEDGPAAEKIRRVIDAASAPESLPPLPEPRPSETLRQRERHD